MEGMAMKTKVNVKRALDVLEEAVPAALASSGAAPDVCVAATRIACLALAEVGIKASPLPVRLQAMSPRYTAAVERNELGSVDEAGAKRLADEGAHMVDIGHPDNDGRPRPDGRRGYNAHLIALVERRWAVDLTIGQASRPAKNMIFAPHHFAVTPAFMAGEPLVFRTDNGATLVYVRVDNNTFVVAPDWQKVRRDDWLVRSTTQRLLRAA
jgi:hypothetical protein